MEYRAVRVELLRRSWRGSDAREVVPAAMLVVEDSADEEQDVMNPLFAEASEGLRSGGRNVMILACSGCRKALPAPGLLEGAALPYLEPCGTGDGLA